MDSLQTKERKYYVYRFLNKDNVITYVGRTVDLYKRFLQHDHLTELLQFIFKSALSKGSEICIYIPSIRMRNLLKQWINENSIENK